MRLKKEVQMRKILLILNLSLLISLVGSTQPCGINQEGINMITERLLQNKARYLENPVQFRDVVYVPLKFHLVAKADGTGRVSEAKVFDQLCALNEDFLDVGIQFYIYDGFNYMNNTTVYDNHAGAQNSIMFFNRESDAINIWIVNDATPGGGGLDGTTLGYYTPQPNLDWLVIKKTEINNNNTTLTHEVGHFFSLDHPFNGWDFEIYNPSDHGTPAPNIATDGTTPVETMDGMNCETAGDFLCDTPPSYGEGFTWNNCNYTGGHLDPNSEPIDPEELNFMDYYLNGCSIDDYFFSDMQKEMILTDYESSNRSYIRTNHVPNQIQPEEVTLLSPADDAETAGYNVQFSWTGVPGAEGYLLEIDKVPSFNIDPIRQIVYGNSKLIEDLEADRNYYWRIRPFNSYKTCTQSTSSFKFRTGLVNSTNNPEFVKDWTVMPNPVRSSESVAVTINAENSFVAQINLYDIAGKNMKRFGNRTFTAGEHTEYISVNGLSSGVYLLSVQTEKGTLNRRIVVGN